MYTDQMKNLLKEEKKKEKEKVYKIDSKSQKAEIQKFE